MALPKIKRKVSSDLAKRMRFIGNLL